MQEKIKRVTEPNYRAPTFGAEGDAPYSSLQKEAHFEFTF